MDYAVLKMVLDLFAEVDSRMTLGEMRVLLYLADHPQSDANTVANAVGVIPPTMSKIITSLSQRRGAERRKRLNLVRLTKIDGDRRKVLLSLTKDGEALMDRIAVALVRRRH